MLRYIVRRLLWVILLLVFVSAITFVIFYVFPSSDPVLLRAGHNPTPELRAAIKHNLGLDQPVYVQYWRYMKALVLHFDFGRSYEFDAPVRKLIFDRLPATASLVAGGVVVWIFFGLLVGVISAARRRTLLDRVSMTGALVFVSAPVYWLGLVALFLFAKDVGKIKLFDGYATYQPISHGLSGWVGPLIMPWFTIAATFAAIYARLLRANLIETMSEDYIRTARAKGLSETRVILRHGMRSAITPIVTVLGLDVGILLGGAILTESVFAIPGMGRLAFDAISRSDLPVVQGTVLLGALFIVIGTLIVDILYAFLDPRVRYS